MDSLNFLYKKYIIGFLVAISVATFSCVPVCKIQNATLRIVRYDRAVNVYTAESVKGEKCLCSFYSDYSMHEGDTIVVDVQKYGDISTFTPPTIKPK